MADTYGNLSGSSGDGNWVFVEGPDVMLKVTGTWGTGTITPQIKSRNGGSAISLTPSTPMTSNATGEVKIDISGPFYLRASLSGATGADLDWEIFGNRAEGRS